MSTTNIYRLSGIVLAVGGLIGVVAFVLDLVVDAHYPHIEDDTLLAATTSAWVIHVALLFISALLIVLALPGLYARLREKGGILGLIAFVLTFIGVMIGDMMNAAISAFALPPLTASTAGRAVLLNNPPYPGIVGGLGGIFTLLGVLLLGIVLVRARVLPRWVGVPLIAGVIVFIPGVTLGANALGPLIIYAGFALCGVMLMSRTTVPATESIPQQV